jgi:hypothetical protein
MLNQPTRITRYLSDLTLRGYWADKVFTPAGGVSGGAILYTQLTQNELFVSSSRDVQNVEPGAEFPLVTFDRPTPLTKQVEKFGGKFFVTDEARDRNDPMMLQQGAQRLANTINRRIHTNAVTEIDAQITALGGSAQTATGNDWSAVVTTGSSQTNAPGWPAADFAKVQLLADQKELGVQFDTWILNPVNANEFKIAYGNEWRSVLDDAGVSSWSPTVSPQAPRTWSSPVRSVRCVWRSRFPRRRGGNRPPSARGCSPMCVRCSSSPTPTESRK